jgi:transposase InsO family protein
VLEVRDEHPKWGARKIKRFLENRGHRGLPSPSTITAVLGRHGRLDAEGVASGPWSRFEREHPMDLLQMDFKGHFPIRDRRCHPLSLVDDHSRYLLGLDACRDERCETVQERLTEIFRRYGLPDSINTDNGAPWASLGAHGQITQLGLWLIRLGIRLSRSREYHPQTNGKVERFHRTLKAEVLQARSFADFDECQSAFDDWRYVYNFERPHQALDLKTPSQRFQMSSRRFPEVLPEIEYGPDDQVRKVQDGGIISFRGVDYRVGRALRGLPVAVRPTAVDGGFDVFCVRQKVLNINFLSPLGGREG